MFRALFRKSLFTLFDSTLTGESALVGAVGGRLFPSDLFDLEEDEALFFAESLRERLFLLSERVRFFMELLLVSDGDFPSTESVLLLVIGVVGVAFFFTSGDQEGVDAALAEDGLNREYFVESSMRSD